MYGDSYKNNIVAVMLPNQNYLLEWAKENGINGNVSELIVDKKVIKAVIDSFHTLGNKYKKKKFEFIMNIKIVGGEWTPENGLLTAAMKLKRQDIVKFYKKEIDEMYKELKEE
jgi:long-chain acyl-CoA synthetase